MDRVLKEDYTPTNQDILNLRVVTQSITDNEFYIEGRTWHFYDVSGLKHHRKAWLPFFDNVSGVLFVVSLSCYNQTLVEEPSKNRMRDSIELFKSIATNPILENSNFLLFFNKADLYERKIAKRDFRDYFPDFKGKDGSRTDAYEYLKMKFQQGIKDSLKLVAIHKTCCTDTNMIEKIIKSVV